MKKLIKFLIIHLSRNDWHKERIEKQQKRILYIFIVLFFSTAFNYDFYNEGVMIGGTISLNLTTFLIEIFLFGIFTFVSYLYNESYISVMYKYKEKISNNKTVICAYPDDEFEKIVYDIDIDEFGTAHIHHNDNRIYRLNDWKIFKFVNVKESRKLKLKKLMNNID